MYDIKEEINTISKNDIVTIGCGPVMGENTFPHTETTETEQAAALAKVYDLSAEAYINLATSATGAGYASNYQLFPGTEAIGDYVVFGAAAKFNVLKIDVSATAATYSSDALEWYYYGASGWTALTLLYDGTTTTADKVGERAFMQDGYIVFSAPSDWTLATIDSQSAYWIKSNVAAATITQIPLLDSHEHYIVTLPNASKIPYYGTVGEGRLCFETTSGSTADTKVILVNGTNKTASAVKTITKAKKDFVVTDFSLEVDKDDVVAFICTDDDGSTEYAGGTCELTIAKTLE